MVPKGAGGAGNGSGSRIRKQCPGGGPMIRSSSRSFAPSNLFNERIYELNDNSGSVMTDHTPTFASNYHQPFRGTDSRTLQSQVCLFIKSAKLPISTFALLIPCMEFETFCVQIPSFEVL